MKRKLPMALALLLALLCAGCARAPGKALPTPSTASPVVDYALSLEGMPYRQGKASPEDGFDCSGLVWHVYRHLGIAIPRTTQAMAELLLEVPEAERQPGDLLFFNTGEKPFSHVALYLGGNAFIHAPSSKTGRVMVSGLDQPYWRQRLAGARRPTP